MERLLISCVVSLALAGCVTDGEGTRNVTIETIKIVCLSHKDTAGTVRQVSENNGALKVLGAPQPTCK